ncbi:MAG: hypothetical protein EOR73_09990 [Mesorhizobium sp.]|nr:MAG: hypothetical protein EOR73_09990 [Mesorhizobium sp.]
MSQLIDTVALKTIHLCAKPGEVDAAGKVLNKAKINIVPAGKIFHCDQATFDDLSKSDAVRIATSLDVQMMGADSMLPPHAIPADWAAPK